MLSSWVGGMPWIFHVTQPLDAKLLKEHFKLDMSVDEVQEVLNEYDRQMASLRIACDTHN